MPKTALPPIGQRTLIYAHRGAMAYRPQNTMAAFELAWQMGAHGIELDVQCSRDGVVVVFHDDTLDTLTNGTGRVRDDDWADLQQLDAGSHFADEYAYARIPTLEAVLRARPAHGFINIEIKTELHDETPEQQAERANADRPMLTRQPNSPIEIEARRIAQHTADCIRHVALDAPDLARFLIVSSFHPIALEAFAHAMPDIVLAQLFSNSTAFNTAPIMAELAHDAVHIDAAQVTAAIVKTSHANDKYLNCWTVNDAAHARQLIAWRVDGILTNCPDVLLALLPQFNTQSLDQQT